MFKTGFISRINTKSKGVIQIISLITSIYMKIVILRPCKWQKTENKLLFLSKAIKKMGKLIEFKHSISKNIHSLLSTYYILYLYLNSLNKNRSL